MIDEVWNIMLGGCLTAGWGNNEKQLYTDENHKLKWKLRNNSLKQGINTLQVA
jgi:hypothetical protein